MPLKSVLIRAFTGPVKSTCPKNSGLSKINFPDNEKVGTGVGVGVGFGFGKRCQLGFVSELLLLGQLRLVLSMLIVQIFPGESIITIDCPSGDQYGVYESKLKSFLRLDPSAFITCVKPKTPFTYRVKRIFVPSGDQRGSTSLVSPFGVCCTLVSCCFPVPSVLITKSSLPFE